MRLLGPIYVFELGSFSLLRQLLVLLFVALGRRLARVNHSDRRVLWVLHINVGYSNNGNAAN